MVAVNDDVIEGDFAAEAEDGAATADPRVGHNARGAVVPSRAVPQDQVLENDLGRRLGTRMDDLKEAISQARGVDGRDLAVAALADAALNRELAGRVGDVQVAGGGFVFLA